jgi:hypothetical protein
MERRKRAQTTASVRAAQGEVENLSRSIFNTLFGVKVLDPTMGSGHFLVHTVDDLADRIVAFLARHPGNPVIAAIERMRKAILADLKAQQLDDREITRIAGKLTEISLIKRMVMKRCVYGVDLNPMAVELAKLSLWLDSFTLGAPLSFLDHHLKCGNTLIGAQVETVQGELAADLFGNRFAGMLQATELMREVGELTDATVAEVEESETKFEHAREALTPFTRLLDIWQAEPFGHAGARKALHHSGGEIETIQRGKRGKERVQAQALLEGIEQTAADHRFFHWELEFPEVWYGGGRRLDQPGFDAVIGNPPWVRQETLTNVKKVLESAFPSVYHGVADIYAYVLARGLAVLKQGGRLGFILPNKWLRANYGEPLRTLLTTHYQPELLVDFGHAPLFPDADTFPVVAVIRRPTPSQPPPNLGGGQEGVRVCPVPREALDGLKLAPYVEKHTFGVPTLLLKPEGWALEPPEVLRLFEKIKHSGRPLKEVIGDVPYRGIVTGLNEAFFIDQATRDRLIAEDSKCEPLIKKLVRGRNIQRWTAEWEKEWIIFAHHGINIDQYPSIKAHLLKFKKELEPKPDNWKPKEKDEKWPGRKPGIYKWYELQDPVEYHEKFEEPKIVYQEIQFHSWFALDEDGHYLNNKAFLIPSGDRYLLALLNSSPMWWFLWRYLPHMKDEALSPVAFLMENFPFVSPSKAVRASIEERATTLIESAKAFAQARAAFLQWVTHETGLAKVPASLETPWQLQPEGFLAELKKAGLKRATPATLQHLTQTFEREAAALRTNRTEALCLERELDELILKVYKLTPDEIALLRRTAPPRSPIAVLENDLKPTSTH